MELNRIEDIIADIKLGKMVILMDDEDRENEGDILIAAEKITAEHINFMAKEGRGLICLTITEQRAKQLSLEPMVKNNTEQFGTNFTVSIEAAQGVTTGISAQDRAITIQAASASNATPLDIVSPGHIFPIIARPGGVLLRAGHTEAGCDIARLAGLEPSCAIVEILNPDGTMARRAQLEQFATQHNIKLGTIADLIRYRLSTEMIVEKIEQQPFISEFGLFELHVYRDKIYHAHHYVLSKDAIDSKQATLVRVHNANIYNDILHKDCSSWTISQALTKLATEGGVFVLINNPNDHCQQEFLQALQNPMRKSVQVSQEIGIGSQILFDMGVRKIQLLSSSDNKYHALSGFHLEVVDYIPK